MGIPIFDGIEKLINEHGSSVILNQQLAFAKERFAGLERKVAELQTQVGRLEAQLDREMEDHKSTAHKLQQLENTWAEEVRIHYSVEFRKGKRTWDKWAAFCPKCHLPARYDAENYLVTCADGQCSWAISLGSRPLEQAIRELTNPSAYPYLSQT
jgi:hypothetical protein